MLEDVEHPDDVEVIGVGNRPGVHLKQLRARHAPSGVRQRRRRHLARIELELWTGGRDSL
jgi:hypothetical protein